MSDRPSEDTFLTVVQVAERLRVVPQTVRNWIARGQLRAVRVGPRRVRVRQVDLDRFLADPDARPALGAQRSGMEVYEGRRSASALAPFDPEIRDRFLDAAFELVRLSAGAHCGDPRSALRTLARHAELWADALERGR
jgi:excisionase family DNA binding protein